MAHYCDSCGHPVNEGDEYCERCGAHLVVDERTTTSADTRPQAFVQIKRIANKRTAVIIGALFLLVCIAYGADRIYRSYAAAQNEIRATQAQLGAEQTRLESLSKPTNQASSSSPIPDATLAHALDTDKEPSIATSAATSVSGINSLAPSEVKIVCASDRDASDLQLGSGVLYKSTASNPAPYFVETNAHVVETDDGSAPECSFAVYPDYTNSSYYLLYHVASYQTYSSSADFVYLIPEVSDGDSAGTIAELSQYAHPLTQSTYCAASDIGNHVTILGYPGVGGSSLTATDGIIAGYEYDDGFRFIKTSAKIEHGNSGGVAFMDNGCILGIPTFSDEGELESLGRILDLHALFNN